MSIETWSPLQVKEYFSQHTTISEPVLDIFVKEEIPGSVLPTLDESDLKDLGFLKFGDRRQISKEIANLEGNLMDSESKMISRLPIKRTGQKTQNREQRGGKSNTTRKLPRGRGGRGSSSLRNNSATSKSTPQRVSRRSGSSMRKPRAPRKNTDNANDTGSGSISNPLNSTHNIKRTNSSGNIDTSSSSTTISKTPPKTFNKSYGKSSIARKPVNPKVSPSPNTSFRELSDIPPPLPSRPRPKLTSASTIVHNNKPIVKSKSKSQTGKKPLSTQGKGFMGTMFASRAAVNPSKVMLNKSQPKDIPPYIIPPDHESPPPPSLVPHSQLEFDKYQYIGFYGAQGNYYELELLDDGETWAYIGYTSDYGNGEYYQFKDAGYPLDWIGPENGKHPTLDSSNFQPSKRHAEFTTVPEQNQPSFNIVP